MFLEERFSKKIWLWLFGVDIFLCYFFKLCLILLEKVWEVVIGLIKVIECYGVLFIVFKLKIKKKKEINIKYFWEKNYIY